MGVSSQHTQGNEGVLFNQDGGWVFFRGLQRKEKDKKRKKKKVSDYLVGG